MDGTKYTGFEILLNEQKLFIQPKEPTGSFYVFISDILLGIVSVKMQNGKRYWSSETKLNKKLLSKIGSSITRYHRKTTSSK
ncbi:hypothetical protein LY11_03425 [Pedobacter cryoconitis]|uniref:Uncharacterized protein n=1 Tax=Pedobacter cryoconitis TaxID=188932 RepID=A0A327SHS9_9SPHI|nr:hypothetical protein LY11_03425 [Pedobacter cryoconitis]